MNNGSGLYKAAVIGDPLPSFTSPGSGSDILLSEQEFTWSANAYPGTITQWATYVGSTTGAFDFGVASHGNAQVGTMTGWDCLGGQSDIWVTL